MSPLGVASVAMGGALGAVARYALGAWIQARWGAALPWATFAVNVTGSLALGFLYGLGQGRVPEAVRLGIGVGGLGAYTTFSTFEWEILEMAQRGQHLQAAAYVLSSVLSGLVAAWAGWMLARAVAG